MYKRTLVEQHQTNGERWQYFISVERTSPENYTPNTHLFGFRKLLSFYDRYSSNGNGNGNDDDNDNGSDTVLYLIM